MSDIPAHQQTETHHYKVSYPNHVPRANDPHYKDFDHYHKLHRPMARCYVGERVGFQDCKDAQGNQCQINGMGFQSGLELHHSIVEDALINAISLAALEVDYHGISNPTQVGDWVESDQNFRWLCVWHHRGAAGAHSASHSDFESSLYIPGLITKA